MSSSLETFASRLDLAFKALYEDQDWEAYLDIYHPAACIAIGTRLAPRNEISVERYESWFEEAFMIAQPDRPPCRFAIARGHVLEATRDEAHVLLDITEETSGWQGQAHSWARASDGKWLLGGLCFVGPSQPAPSLATLPVFLAVEFAHLEGALEAGLLLLTPMDSSFRRLRESAPEGFLALEESRFTCQNSGHCCSGSLSVGLSDREGLALLQHPLARIDPRIPETEPVRGNHGHPWQIAADGERCGFHLDMSCKLHATAGLAPVVTCSTFPLGFTRTPVGVRVWSSFTCPTVRANIGERLADRQADLAGRYRLVRNGCEAIPDEVPWVTDGPAIPFETFAALESKLLEMLADRTLSVPARLDELARRLHAEGASRTGAESPAAPPDETPSVSPALPVTIDRLMASYVVARSMKRRVKGQTTWSGQMMDPLDRHWPLETIKNRTDCDLVTRFLRQVLFRLIDLAEIGVVGHIHRVVWIGRAIDHIARFCAATDGRNEVLDEDLESAVQAAEKAFMHNRGFFDKLGADANFMSWLSSPGAVMTKTNRTA